MDMIPADCMVIRDGQLVKVPASTLVVGDRVSLSLGNKVPADLRLVQASSDTRFDRAVLTGESEAIEGTTHYTDENFLESKNIAFMGTHVVQGSCVGVVVLKGNDTLMGRINKLTTGRKEKVTIIQQEISRFVRIIVCLTIFLATLILSYWAGFLHVKYREFMPVNVLLVTLMGCVVAFIPEGKFFPLSLSFSFKSALLLIFFTYLCEQMVVRLGNALEKKGVTSCAHAWTVVAHTLLIHTLTIAHINFFDLSSPLGMPVCVSLTLMMIARRMRSNNILPKALTTVETLGCVNVICSDKTGTLTENKMFVTNIAFLDNESTPDEARAKIEKHSNSKTLPLSEEAPSVVALRQLQLATLLCNNAKFDPETLNLPVPDRTVHGDATDSALLRFSAQVADFSDLAPCFERTQEIPFNSRNKWMMSVYQGSAQNPQPIKALFGSDMMNAGMVANEKDSQLVFVKGAPDVLLPHCTSFVSGLSNIGQPLTSEWSAELSRIQMQWSRQGKRVLMLCKGRFSPYMAEARDNAGSSLSTANQEELARQGLQELCIIGLIGIMDPPRPEIRNTIASCRRAGARFFMVTGDFGLTAAAIAKQIGLFSSHREPDTYEDVVDPSRKGAKNGLDASYDDLGVFEPGRPRFRESTSLLLTGTDLARISPGEWDLVCAYEEIVFARTSPEQKLKIVTEFQHRDGVVAVTGDGVNDAPALKAADVGVAVVSGSDVAIEAADLILLGGFDSIPVAMRLGRIVFQNLQKVIGYLLPAGSWSEIFPVLINTFLGTPLSLSSFLMIIICCFTDGFPCTALVMEQEEFDLLALPPRNSKKEHLITAKIYLQSYVFIGSVMTFFSNMLFYMYIKEYTGVPFKDLVFTYGYPNFQHRYPHIDDDMFNNYYVNTGQCVTFVALVIMQWGNVLSIRNRRMSILQADPIRPKRRNLWLFAGMFTSLLMAIFVTQVPWINQIMLTNPVPIKYWLLPFPCALAVLLLDEIRKLMLRTFPNSIFGKLAW